MRCLVLKERKMRQVRLTAEESAFLLREHSHHLKLTPTTVRNQWQITSSRLVGSFRGPTIEYVIRPKLSLNRLLFFLEACEGEPSGHSIMEALIHRFLDLWEERLRIGLAQDYRERREQSDTLRGRLDTPAQMRETSRTSIHSMREERTTEIACNQIPRATLDLLSRSKLIGDALRDRIQELIRQTNVEPTALSHESMHAAMSDRNATGYRPVLDLCRLFWEDVQPSALLVNLEQIFERYVTRSLREHLSSSLTLEEQPWMILAHSLSGQPSIGARPDLLLRREGKPDWILDMKWKSLPRQGPQTSDLYQMLAYCFAFGCQRGMLIYPAAADQELRFRVGPSRTLILARGVKVNGSIEDCRESMRRLAKSLESHDSQ